MMSSNTSQYRQKPFRLQLAVHRKCPDILTDLERFCKEYWVNITYPRCAMLIDSYQKSLSAIRKSKGA